MDTYESVLDQILSVPDAPSGLARDIHWLNESQALAVARDQAGRLEVFLPGERLEPRTATVREALQHHDWHRDSGPLLSANRILLPALGHFDQVGSFICTELLRNGAEDDMVQAFSLTEPIIELAIRRLQISEGAMLGLAGELLILNSLVHEADDPQVGTVLQSWAGWHRSQRDFAWNRVGVEVKTTKRVSSSHMVQGVHQVDAIADTDDGPGEGRLLLVSIGLANAAASSNTFSIPMLVDRILDRLSSTGNTALADSLLQHLAAYGSESGFGYDHQTMSRDAPFTDSYATTFCRGYDMSDPAIEVLRHDTVAAHHHVDAQSLRFTINLPAIISGQNPVNGANQIARNILD
ncbi:PD-(D/E)XK motif protein [Ornithinimicrobium pratense]|nr:PD-(D/E)XK motif protein [Ornithinimicrobium pratense]